MATTNYKAGSVTATGVVAQLGCQDGCLPITAVVGGTFVGTVQCEVCMDTEAVSPTWIIFGTAITAPGTFKVDIFCKAVRLRCTAYTSGTITGGVGVRNQGR